MYKRCQEILDELETKKNVKIFKDFKFPEKQELKLRLKNMLEDNVDEKYYLSDKQVSSIKASSLCARDWKDPKCVQVGQLEIERLARTNETCLF